MLLLAKNSTYQGRPTEIMLLQRHVKCRDQSGTRKMAILAMADSIITAKCVSVSSVRAPIPPSLSHEQCTLESLLRERISLRGICRAVGVNLPWLFHFMVECFAASLIISMYSFSTIQAI